MQKVIKPSLRGEKRRSNISRFQIWDCHGGLFLISFMVALLAMTPLGAKSLASIEAFNRGVQYFNARQIEEAMPYFDKAIEHDEEFTEAYYARAACKHARKDMQGAISDLNKTLRLNPDFVDAYAMRGAIYYESEQWDAALEDFNAVLKRHPRDPQALLGRAVISLKKDQLDTTQHDIRLFLKVRPDDPLAPRLRRLLASLSKDEEKGGGEGEEAATPQRPAASATARVRGTPSPKSKQLAEDLFTGFHQLSDSYGRKVLRGERAEAVGDINAVRPSQPSGQDVQIVEPNSTR
jgi:tetratricopeptide (TPR) repeat protein